MAQVRPANNEISGTDSMLWEVRLFLNCWTLKRMPTSTVSDGYKEL